MNDDIWDDEVSERQLQINLHSIQADRELAKIKQIKYQEGFIAGSDFEDEVSYKEGFEVGYDYSVNIGCVLGSIDVILKLSECGLLGICEKKKKVLKESKKKIEEEMIKIEADLNEKLEIILNKKCKPKDENLCECESVLT